MTNREKEHIKGHMPYYGAIKTKGRYSGIKAKAWAILSDYVRCRDWHKHGTCVATGVRIADWRESDAGHYVVAASNGATVGFDPLNVHMQSKISNKLSSAEDGASFGRELIRRYGDRILPYLAEQKRRTVKADSWYFIGRIERIHDDFLKLIEEFPNGDYPDYMKKK